MTGPPAPQGRGGPPSLSEAQRQVAMGRHVILRPHLEASVVFRVERVMRINDLSIITGDVIETALEASYDQRVTRAQVVERRLEAGGGGRGSGRRCPSIPLYRRRFFKASV